jgi:hypothetical protein
VGKFGATLSGFRDETVDELNRITRESVFSAGNRVIVLSPVKTGQFADNWFYGLMTPDTRTHGPTGARAINNIEEMPEQPFGFIHYLSNALPYGPALERGSSTQAPQGMVGVLAIEWPSMVARIAAGRA